MELVTFLVFAGAVALVVLVVSTRNKRHIAEVAAAEMAGLVAVAAEEVTRFGEELQRLDTEAGDRELDDAERQDYQRALDSYEAAKTVLDQAKRRDEIAGVTEAIEDGRYAIACVRARLAGDPLPARRPPCFFNPQHGPSVSDITWAPAGGGPRRIPVCAADAERIAAGAEPATRLITVEGRRVPYWEAGPGYAPYARGYFNAYSMTGLVPAFLLGSMIGGWDAGGSFAEGFDGAGGTGDAGFGDLDGLGTGTGSGEFTTGFGEAGTGDAGFGDFGGGDFGGGGDF